MEVFILNNHTQRKETSAVKQIYMVLKTEITRYFINIFWLRIPIESKIYFYMQLYIGQTK